MKSIDFKSLLIGILGTALVLVLMGQTNLKEHYEVECVFIPDQPKGHGHFGCRKFDSKEPWKEYLPYIIWRVDEFYTN